MRVILPNPHGFCAGVVMAVECVEQAIRSLGTPLFVFHEIVHNQRVVKEFEARGVVFVDSVDQVPRGSNLIFSAHGVSPQIREIARQRNLYCIDATCPLVAKVHSEAIRYARSGHTIVLIGHQGHDEVLGVIGEAPEQIVLVESVDEVAGLQIVDADRVAYLTQTTLSVDEAKVIIHALRARFPEIKSPPKADICYATQNRQDAVRRLCEETDVVLVVGSENSSNSQRLRELATSLGATAYLIDDVEDIEPMWFQDVETVLLTAGASAPETLVDECLQWMSARLGATIERPTVQVETTRFTVPLFVPRASENTQIPQLAQP